jgi:hypothetical protein
MRQAQNRIELFGRNRWIMDMKMTSALAPALSPGRGRIVRRSFENIYDRVGRTLFRKPRDKRKLFPLPGERIK